MSVADLEAIVARQTGEQQHLERLQAMVDSTSDDRHFDAMMVAVVKAQVREVLSDSDEEVLRYR